jgi:hypothetical protein
VKAKTITPAVFLLGVTSPGGAAQAAFLFKRVEEN